MSRKRKIDECLCSCDLGVSKDFLLANEEIFRTESRESARKNLKQLFNQIDDQKLDELLELFRLPKKSKPLEFQVVSSETVEHHAQLFTKRYHNPTGSVKKFVHYVKQCIKVFNENKTSIDGPYIGLVQSSGYGKSRLLREVSKHVRTMYVCMRRKESTGYPPRSDDACEALFNGLPSDNADLYAEKFADRLKKCLTSALTRLPVPDESDSRALFPSDSQASTVWNFQHVSSNVPEMTSTVLVVIDEARALVNDFIQGVSKFRLIRRAIRDISLGENKSAAEGENKSAAEGEDIPAAKVSPARGGSYPQNFLVVFVDTSSEINDFSPALIDDESSRARNSEAQTRDFKFLHPFIHRNAFDCGLPKYAGDLSDLSGLVDSTNYLLAGRPLLSTEGAVLSEKEKVFLRLKLSKGSRDLSNEGALGSMLCRLAASVNPHHRFASELVANNMATLLATDIKRETMLVSYVAEPKLAIAAADYWQAESVFVSQLIPALQSALSTGSVSQGPRGELVAQIIFLFAFDAACKASSLPVGSCVKITDVLTQLLPEDSLVDVTEAVPVTLREAKAACCQFVGLAHRPSPQTFVDLALRHCGAAFRENQERVDLGIPIMANSSSIVIQVKKWCCLQQKIENDSNFWCHKMLPSSAFSADKFEPQVLETMNQNCVRVLMQLGAELQWVDCQKIEGEALNLAAPLQIFGFPKSRCLTKSVFEHLQVILHGRVDLQSFCEMTDKEWKNMPVADYMEDVQSAWPFLIDKHCDFSDLTVRELRKLCKKNLLQDTSHKKEDLVNSSKPK